MRLLVPAALRRYSGGAQAVEVSGATIAEAVADLCRQYPALRARVLDAAGELHPYLLVCRNDESATLGSAIGPEDVIELVAAAEGG